MKPFFRIRLLKRSLISLMQIIGLIFFILYVCLPLAFRFLPTFQRHMVFLPYVRWPFGVDFADPESQGLSGARNLYLETDADVKVGVWHILPESVMDAKFETPEDSFSSGHPIILYLHGNSGSRAGSHRIELYKILQSLNYHVVTMDYRGYADSTQAHMSEDGVITDATAVYNYIKKHSKDAMIVVWGHSLGTGVASRTVGQLCSEKRSPDRLILEAPFNNIRDEIRNHPLSYIFRPIPAFDWFFTEPLVANDLAFDSDLHIPKIDSPILILHAQDDAVIPIILAKKLYEVALNKRPAEWPPVQFVEFHYNFGYAHKYICRAPELPSIIQEYIDSSLDTRKSGKQLIA
ncbi:lysophosphatidylserine lipase ABHD12-like [Daphnia pulex]|uniref:lysophosphatidylserine lipase ABHD12-like n=1 Tax=Daphnia pulex TaxID=6669 RepID=UPI001EDCEAAB|nr:lysophosphatidylserine lipase ABHD12-like [Daphnia pulex]XP_046646034.1 lysophosphatidylserine lipase ABHD12-like [Daphnia pulicaria]